MANVNIKFNGKDYLLSCDDGQEENLKELANILSNKFKLMVDENKDGYEKMLDMATESIEKFIQSSSKDKRLQ